MSDKRELAKESAFPFHDGFVQGGMTKREYFAGLAIQPCIESMLAPAVRELLTGSGRIDPNDPKWAEVRALVVKGAIAFADELLEQLEKSP